MNGVDSKLLKRLYELTELEGEPETEKQKKSLKKVESQKPSGYDSRYAKMSDKLLNEYLNNGSFSYNPYSDSSYVSYVTKMKKEGQNAMRDTLAKASELTGGYSSSYGENAAISAYNSYLEKLSDAISEFEEQAYERYKDNRDYSKDKVDLVSSLDDNAYSRYRDDMSDYYKDRDYYYDKYEDSVDEYAAEKKTAAGILEQLAKLGNDDFYKLLNARIKMTNNQ